MRWFMSINMNRATERPLVSENPRLGEYNPRIERGRLTELGPLAEKNLWAKKAMASELASMGLPKRAIDRLLHIKGEANVKGSES